MKTERHLVEGASQDWRPYPSKLPLTSSVVICAYTLDRLGLLTEALKALQRDDVAELKEVVVVVDHNDELFKTLKSVSSWEKITVLRSTRQAGLSGARNTGLLHVESDLVFFLDDDAVPQRSWLHNMSEIFDQPAVLGVGGWVEPDWETDPPHWWPRQFDWVVGCSYIGLPESGEDIRNPIGAAMGFRRSVLLAAGLFPEDVGRVGTTPVGCEETAVSIAIMRQCDGGRIVHCKEAVVLHKVPKERVTLAYFVARCRGEGRSKAQVTRLYGSSSALAAERTYIREVLRAGLLDGLRQPRRQGRRGLVILVGLIVTGGEYLRCLTVLTGRSGPRI